MPAPFGLLPRDAAWGSLLVPLALANTPLWSLTHESIHGSLLRDRGWNDRLGRALAIGYGAPFALIKAGHLLHHRFSRTPRERTEVFDPAVTSWRRQAPLYCLRLFGGLYLAGCTTSTRGWPGTRCGPLSSPTARGSTWAGSRRPAARWKGRFPPHRQRCARVRLTRRDANGARWPDLLRGRRRPPDRRGVEPGDDVDTLLRDADPAMYAAKHNGKGTWMRYHAGMEPAH
jgi:hypothetical protein